MTMTLPLSIQSLFWAVRTTCERNEGVRDESDEADGDDDEGCRIEVQSYWNRKFSRYDSESGTTEDDLLCQLYPGTMFMDGSIASSPHTTDLNESMLASLLRVSSYKPMTVEDMQEGGCMTKGDRRGCWGKRLRICLCVFFVFLFPLPLSKSSECSRHACIERKLV